MSTKNILRAKMLAHRSELGPDKISQFNFDLCKNLQFVWSEAGGLGDRNNRPLWAGYKSFRWEADPQNAMSDAEPYIRWIYPRILPDLSMEFYEPESSSQWLKNS